MNNSETGCEFTTKLLPPIHTKEPPSNFVRKTIDILYAK